MSDYDIGTHFNGRKLRGTPKKQSTVYRKDIDNEFYAIIKRLYKYGLMPIDISCALLRDKDEVERAILSQDFSHFTPRLVKT